MSKCHLGVVGGEGMGVGSLPGTSMGVVVEGVCVPGVINGYEEGICDVGGDHGCGPGLLVCGGGGGKGPAGTGGALMTEYDHV